MIDHVVINVRDLEKSRHFYEKALAPLGYTLLMSFPGGAGFGMDGKPFFWIARREPQQTGVHVAFQCTSRKTVDQCHAAALAAGATDNGAPGPRPQYHASYYGAFVHDPDGHNIEAVCHDPQG